jgi:hypothetical protein
MTIPLPIDALEAANACSLQPAETIDVDGRPHVLLALERP